MIVYPWLANLVEPSIRSSFCGHLSQKLKDLPVVQMKLSSALPRPFPYTKQTLDLVCRDREKPHSPILGVGSGLVRLLCFFRLHVFLLPGCREALFHEVAVLIIGRPAATPTASHRAQYLTLLSDTHIDDLSRKASLRYRFRLVDRELVVLLSLLLYCLPVEGAFQTLCGSTIFTRIKLEGVHHGSSARGCALAMA